MHKCRFFLEKEFCSCWPEFAPVVMFPIPPATNCLELYRSLSLNDTKVTSVEKELKRYWFLTDSCICHPCLWTLLHFCQFGCTMTCLVKCEYFLDFFRALFDCSRIEILRPIFLQPSRGIPDFVNWVSFLVRIFRPSREYFHASMAFLLDINPFCKEGRPKERATLLAHSFHGPIANFPILQISRRVS